jgi:hypothetical protein
MPNFRMASARKSRFAGDVSSRSTRFFLMGRGTGVESGNVKEDVVILISPLIELSSTRAAEMRIALIAEHDTGYFSFVFGETWSYLR